MGASFCRPPAIEKETSRSPAQHISNYAILCAPVGDGNASDGTVTFRKPFPESTSPVYRIIHRLNSKVSADHDSFQALNLPTHRSIIGHSTAQHMIRTVVLIHLGVISSVAHLLSVAHLPLMRMRQVPKIGFIGARLTTHRPGLAGRLCRLFSPRWVMPSLLLRAREYAPCRVSAAGSVGLRRFLGA